MQLTARLWQLSAGVHKSKNIAMQAADIFKRHAWFMSNISAHSPPTFNACRLIYTLREYPNTEDFVYLKRMDRNPSEYDPYALEVVPFSALDQSDFYTMSVRGITHYMGGSSMDYASACW